MPGRSVDRRWMGIVGAIVLLASPGARAEETAVRPGQSGPQNPSPVYRRAAACAGEVRSAEFDYWLGEWDVRPFASSAGGVVHANEVTLEQGGCVLQEHWRSAPDSPNAGYTGTSFTVFDAKRGLWHQTWVDNVGGLSLFEGGPDARGDIVLLNIPPAGEPPGAPRTRMSYRQLEDGGVRQIVERSTDGGATWTATIDLHYRRRPESPAPRPAPGR